MKECLTSFSLQHCLKTQRTAAFQISWLKYIWNTLLFQIFCDGITTLFVYTLNMEGINIINGYVQNPKLRLNAWTQAVAVFGIIGHECLFHADVKLADRTQWDWRRFWTGKYSKNVAVYLGFHSIPYKSKFSCTCLQWGKLDFYLKCPEMKYAFIKYLFCKLF